MGKKSGPSAPDYTSTANAQAAASKDATTAQTWANRPDQTSPFGSVTWDSQKAVDPSTGQTVTRWTQNTALDPTIQGTLDSQLGLQRSRTDLAQNQLGAVQQSMGQPMDWGQFTPLAQGPQATNTAPTTAANGFNFGAQPIDTSRQRSPMVNQSLMQTPQLDTSRSTTPQLNTNLSGGAGAMVRGLDFGGAQSLGTASDTRARAEDAVYQSQVARLDPRFAQQQSSLESDLANRGISRNSDAYSRAMDDFGRTRNDAYAQAQLAAITAGGNEAQRDYSMNLGTRQQQVGEASALGAFANSAQQQAYNQLTGDNSALAAQYGLDSAARSQQQAAQESMFGMGNTARAQQLNAQQAAFNFGNTARQTQLGAQQQASAQDMQLGRLGMDQQAQAFNQGLQANNQAFSQQQSGANYQNQLRQQQIAEAMRQRSQPLDEMNALLNGQTVSNPTFQNFGQAAGSQTPDLLGAQTAQYTAALNQASNRNAANGDLLGGLTSIAGMYFSDRRVKRILRRIGTHPRGFGIYLMRYIGERRPRVGVIAQEVRRVMPEAVHANGRLLMVDYSAL